MAIPTELNRSLEQSGHLREMAIDLSDKAEDRTAIIEILRSKLYSDKILAPIREYSTNAMDSQIEAGCGDEPISITLPTTIFPELRIRDYGTGLTPLEIEQIYIKYGRSTKRGTNALTGQLGLGCKSAFAYGENFVVVSYKSGTKTTYNLTINGVCTVLFEEAMEDGDRNGIEVVIPIQPEHISECQRKAVNFFKYWKVCPDLKCGDPLELDRFRKALTMPTMFSGDNWCIRPSGYSTNQNGVAVMGNVPYPINWTIVTDKLKINQYSSDGTLFDFIKSNETVLHFPIGTLDFSASRESLEYTDKTCALLVKNIRNIIDNIFSILDSKIKNAPTYWDALLIYGSIFGRDGDRLFAGELHKLENIYKNKFSWKDIIINGAKIQGLQRWDRELGYSNDCKWVLPNGLRTTPTSPVLETYTLHKNKVRRNTGDVCEIIASTKNVVIIHDLEKHTLSNSIIKYLYNNTTGGNFQGRVYMLRFGSDAQEKEFYATQHFESVPVIRVSDIIDKVKTWLGRNRGPNTTKSIVRDQATVRYVTPRSITTSTFATVNWEKVDIDIKDEEGYYIDFNSGISYIGGRPIYNVKEFAEHTHVLLTALQEPISNIYALTDRTRKTKWFLSAKEDDQWIHIVDFFKSKIDSITDKKSTMISKAISFYQYDSPKPIGINFAKSILPFCKNTNGVMYKVCSEISPDFTGLYNLYKAMQYFDISINTVVGITDWSSIMNSVYDTYPMLIDVISSNTDGKYPMGFIDRVANYVNLVDSVTKTVDLK